MGLYLLVVVIAFALVVFSISVFTRRVADSALTDQFRAAESITNGRFPEKWLKQINRHQAIQRLLPFQKPEASETGQSLRKIDRLIQFFEKSPFFENVEARELLLMQLKETRQHWSTMSWEEIEIEYRNGEFTPEEV
jgi:hypothetical protein